MRRLTGIRTVAGGRIGPRLTRDASFAVAAVVWAIVLMPSVSRQACGAEAKRAPNIVFIMADDLGWSELGCYGQEKIRTPHLDRLAREGMRFTDYYSSAPVCAPARCTLLTGLHLGHAYVRDNFEVGSWDSYRGQLPLPDGAVTIASVLKQAGYATGAFGKWGLGEVGSSGDPLRQGFDRFFGYNCQRHAHNYYPRYLVSDREHYELQGNDRGLTGARYAPQEIADQLLAFLRANRQRPFFAYYPSVIPHLALQVPEAELASYRGRWDETPYAGNSYLPHATPRAAYAAMITFLDRQVGRVLDTLDELGLSENTVVFFTSDNGTTHLGEQADYEFFQSVGPLRGLKGSVYEGGIRVPMIVRWPGRIQPGTVSHLPTVHYDALATIAELAGAAAPAATDGISYVPTLLGRDAEQRRHEFLFWDFAGYGGQLAVRKGRWKGVKQGLRKNSQAPLELYDLQKDVGETTDVAAEHPDVAAAIEAIMLKSRVPPEVERFRFGEYPDPG